MNRLVRFGLSALLGISCVTPSLGSDVNRVANVGINTNALVKPISPKENEELTAKVLQEYNKPNVSHTIVTTNRPIRFTEDDREYELQILSLNPAEQKVKLRIDTIGWLKPYTFEAQKGKDYSYYKVKVSLFEVTGNGAILMRVPTK
jgi:hypothetical protein